MLGYGTALEALRSRRGDCTEFAVLLAAWAAPPACRRVSPSVACTRGTSKATGTCSCRMPGCRPGPARGWESFDAAIGSFDSTHLAFAVSYDGNPLNSLRGMNAVARDDARAGGARGAAQGAEGLTSLPSSSMVGRSGGASLPSSAHSAWSPCETPPTMTSREYSSQCGQTVRIGDGRLVDHPASPARRRAVRPRLAAANAAAASLRRDRPRAGIRTVYATHTLPLQALMNSRRSRSFMRSRLCTERSHSAAVIGGAGRQCFAGDGTRRIDDGYARHV